jgi:hypothetical protein
MEKRYCEELGMARSIYHTLINGQLAARVVIRDRFTDEDLAKVREEAQKQLETIRLNKEIKAQRAEAIRQYYKNGGGWRVRWLKAEHFGNDADKRVRSQVMTTNDYNHHTT